MNTVKSFWIGWGSLIVGGGAAYYFAKQSIDAERREKHYQRILAQRRNEELEARGHASASTESARDHLAAQLSEVQEPAPTRHTPDDEEERVNSKSKFEASQPYKARRGDRFS
ncbi:hypothetical protein H072_6306 [Dactylellina haptotyla CBS 200.50]|uniref:Uncharacterized protein n=1 Tax=Dactylellina haptotyla (strain CBS 200.50) TaxID=1284197 RepID=S8BXA4_DACHA|nr:hypothetical protein H072_6306 [Dactylellina haptotyla CBS 200.50]